MSIEIKVAPYDANDPDGNNSRGELAIKKALYRLRTQMDRDGTMDAMLDKKHFISKSERKKIARQKAIYIQKMKNKEWE